VEPNIPYINQRKWGCTLLMPAACCFLVTTTTLHSKTLWSFLFVQGETSVFYEEHSFALNLFRASSILSLWFFLKQTLYDLEECFPGEEIKRPAHKRITYEIERVNETILPFWQKSKKINLTHLSIDTDSFKIKILNLSEKVQKNNTTLQELKHKKRQMILCQYNTRLLLFFA